MEPRATPELPCLGDTDESRNGLARLEVAQVTVEEAAARHGRRDGEREQKQDPGVVVEPQIVTSFHG
jgi:hypothetical protein